MGVGMSYLFNNRVERPRTMSFQRKWEEGSIVIVTVVCARSMGGNVALKS